MRKESMDQRDRAFCRWLERSNHRFVVPVSLVVRSGVQQTDEEYGSIGLQVKTPGHTFAVEFDDDKLAAVIHHADTHWDMIHCYDGAFLRRLTGGCACQSCLLKWKQTLSSDEEFWEQRMFEPFLRWSNLELARSTALAIEGDVHAATSAWLGDARKLGSRTGLRELILLNHRPVRTNESMLRVLMDPASTDDLRLPVEALARWIQRIPQLESFIAAEAALRARFGVLPSDFSARVQRDVFDYEGWLAERFDPTR